MEINNQQYEEYLLLKRKELMMIEEQQRHRQNSKDQIQAGIAGFALCAALSWLFGD